MPIVPVTWNSTLLSLVPCGFPCGFLYFPMAFLLCLCMLRNSPGVSLAWTMCIVLAVAQPEYLESYGLGCWLSESIPSNISKCALGRGWPYLMAVPARAHPYLFNICARMFSSPLQFHHCKEIFCLSCFLLKLLFLFRHLFHLHSEH